MRIGIPREIKSDEKRVAITPSGVAALVSQGHRVLVERNAGGGSGITDAEFRRAGATAIRRRVEELAGFMGIDHLLERWPAALSGGEAGRVALARALATRPAVLLLDEPLAALDEETAEQMIELIQRLRADTRSTVLHVTHRLTEANRLADRILVIEDGKLREASSGLLPPSPGPLQETR